jgi:hypothetical protein
LEFPNSPHKKANKKSVKMFLSYPNWIFLLNLNKTIKFAWRKHESRISCFGQ